VTRRTFVAVTGVTATALLLLWLTTPHHLGPFSAQSNGKTNISLGPFVNTVDPSTNATSACFSDSWTRSCYQSVSEAQTAIGSAQKSFESVSCPSPAKLVGSVGGVEKVAYFVDRATLVRLADVWPGFAPKTISTGSCQVNIYDVSDPAAPNLAISLPAHSAETTVESIQLLGLFQK
jgi:hypothetical protein